MRYIEYCAGIGGTRTGLDAVGWQCALAVDHDPDAVSVHRLVHGSAVERDVTSLSADELPDVDLWVAGFPCQPFSSSGTRSGFIHRSGNVFEHLAHLMEERRPKIVLLENVEGLLSNKSGHTFATVLLSLTRLEYIVDWLVTDLQWFGVPQSRPRLFLVAAQPAVLQPGEDLESDGVLPGIGQAVPSLFATFLAAHGGKWTRRSEGSLATAEAVLRPTIGKAWRPRQNAFRKLGHADGDFYVSYDVSVPSSVPKPGSLASVVAPNVGCPEKIRSARYWSPEGGGGLAGIHIRREALAHCVGTSLGGAPLFAVPLKSIRSPRDRQAFLEFANWHREQDGMLVMRLRPDRAVLLFGPHTDTLYDGVRSWEVGDTRKYVLVGNMVAPVVAMTVADLINKHLRSSTQYRSA